MGAEEGDQLVRWLTLHRSDGTWEKVTLYGAGGVARLGVGSPERGSSVWRIWSNANSSCVYVGPRGITQHEKVSLHASGVYRYAAASLEAMQEWHPEAEDRVMDRWRREDVAPGHPVLTLCFPSDDVVGKTTPRMAKDVRWLPAPPPGRAVAVHLLLTEADAEATSMSGTRFLGAMALAGGREALVLTWNEFELDQVTTDMPVSL